MHAPYLAYRDDYGTFVIERADGTDQRRVSPNLRTRADVAVHWSLSGEYVAFQPAALPDGSHEGLWVVHLPSNTTKLAYQFEYGFAALRWLPGDHLALAEKSAAARGVGWHDLRGLLYDPSIGQILAQQDTISRNFDLPVTLNPARDGFTMQYPFTYHRNLTQNWRILGDGSNMGRSASGTATMYLSKSGATIFQYSPWWYLGDWSPDVLTYTYNQSLFVVRGGEEHSFLLEAGEQVGGVFWNGDHSRALVLCKRGVDVRWGLLADDRLVRLDGPAVAVPDRQPRNDDLPQVVWSPDDRHALFMAADGFYLLDTDTSTTKRIDGLSAAWVDRQDVSGGRVTWDWVDAETVLVGRGAGLERDAILFRYDLTSGDTTLLAEAHFFTISISAPLVGLRGFTRALIDLDTGETLRFPAYREAGVNVYGVRDYQWKGDWVLYDENLTVGGSLAHAVSVMRRDTREHRVLATRCLAGATWVPDHVTHAV